MGLASSMPQRTQRFRTLIKISRRPGHWASCLLPANTGHTCTTPGPGRFFSQTFAGSLLEAENVCGRKTKLRPTAEVCHFAATLQGDTGSSCQAESLTPWVGHPPHSLPSGVEENHLRPLGLLHCTERLPLRIPQLSQFVALRDNTPNPSSLIEGPGPAGQTGYRANSTRVSGQGLFFQILSGSQGGWWVPSNHGPQGTQYLPQNQKISNVLYRLSSHSSNRECGWRR